ncbi:MAG: BatA domain-containing protein [Verrucomicrobia bacterium]|nr:BatA domain-containing protein [Verrucomicrobiota bacterium]
MTFLQPFLLWGLPLVLVPVIIHLINRLRHKPQPWAAMMFLLQATRASTSHAKLRQWLVLLFRTLAVLALVLFIARPLAGGWLGWTLSPAPDVIIIVLDRSASMESRLAGQTVTKREQAVKLLAEAAREFQDKSHLVLLDSATRIPQQLAKAKSLLEPTLTGPTDTAADLPTLLQLAHNWLVENRAGAAELWLASDLQRSNWLPDDERWKAVTAQLGKLPQGIRVRLLAFDDDREPNTSATLAEVFRRARPDGAELNLALDLARNAPAGSSPARFPLALTLNGVKSQTELDMDGAALRWRHKVDLGAAKGLGWGALELPADANARDNAAYFVFGSDSALRATVVSDQPLLIRNAQLAALSPATRQPAEVLTPAAFAERTGSDATLLIWHAPLPDAAGEKRLRGFIEEGGAVLFLPPGRTDTGKFLGFGWADAQPAPADKPFKVAKWEQQEGPLAKTDEGLSLPLADLDISRRQPITGEPTALASFADGSPLLTRRALGKGQFFFCATVPHDDWSTLGDGPVLVPMLQRLLQTGARRLNQETMVACGELSALDRAKQWTSADGSTGKNIALNAGVYRAGERLLAVNRPSAEDDRTLLEPAAAKKLLGTLPLQLLQERTARNDALQGEIWRIFLIGMLAFLFLEAWIVLPNKKPADPLSASIVRMNAVTSPAE